MFNFTDHAFEIFTIGKEQNVDVGVAFDKFKADVITGKHCEYNSGNSIKEFDFAAANAEWNKLTQEGKIVAIEEWHEWIAGNYNAACEAFAEGREAMEALFGGE